MVQQLEEMFLQGLFLSTFYAPCKRRYKGFLCLGFGDTVSLGGPESEAILVRRGAFLPPGGS